MHSWKSCDPSQIPTINLPILCQFWTFFLRVIKLQSTSLNPCKYLQSQQHKQWFFLICRKLAGTDCMLQIWDEDGLYNERRASSDPRLTQVSGYLASHKRLTPANTSFAKNNVMECFRNGWPACRTKVLQWAVSGLWRKLGLGAASEEPSTARARPACAEQSVGSTGNSVGT